MVMDMEKIAMRIVDELGQPYDEEIKALLTGRAEFNISRNDMFWQCTILDISNYEFYNIYWSGYNDSYWWDNVSEKNSVATCKGSEGTIKKFKLDYKTLDVVEVQE